MIRGPVVLFDILHVAIICYLGYSIICMAMMILLMKINFTSFILVSFMCNSDFYEASVSV